MILSDHTHSIMQSGRKALVAFLTAGFPDETTFVELMRACESAGCDVIEVGVPFSDPIADGPTIQQSSQTALDNGMTMERALTLTASCNLTVPVVAMTYVNPVLAMGVSAFAQHARDAGVRGVILPDVSFEESDPFRGDLASGGLEYIDLLAPTSGPERVAAIATGTTGFVYLVAVRGVTGARNTAPVSLEPFISAARKHTKTPLYVGFGISSPAIARDVAALADGVIIGSRLVDLVTQAQAAGTSPVRAVTEFLAEVREALGTQVK